MKKTTFLRYALLFAIIGFLPIKASAATVYLQSSRADISVGDTVIVTAKINAEGTTINTVEGEVAIKSGGSSLGIDEFSLANSAFGLWPRTPSLSKDGQTVSFVGGVPGGFNIEGATLFKIILLAKKEGTVTIAPQNLSVYANDGKGTKLPVKMLTTVIKVGPKKSGTAPTDEWKSLVAADTTPPENFIIVLGQDKTLFDGKKFAFFSALDNQSGVSYYEVSENGAAAVRSGSMYVLQNQDKEVVLDVTAFDKAGNKKMAHYPTSKPSLLGTPWIIVIVIIVVLVVLWVILRKVKKSKRNAQSAI